MKVPKEINRYCDRCKAHTNHKISIYKKGKDSIMVQGKRRYLRKLEGFGSQPKPIQHNQAKVNKKTTPMYKCSKCGRVHAGIALRLKKYEIMAK